MRQPQHRVGGDAAGRARGLAARLGGRAVGPTGGGVEEERVRGLVPGICHVGMAVNAAVGRGVSRKAGVLGGTHVVGSWFV